MKKTIITIIMMFLIIGIFASSANAATTSIGASFNKSEQTVNVTVSFSEKVSAAQFVLNYDSNKVTYISNSAGGQFGESTKRFAYANATPNLTSVTFTFKSRTTGNCSFSIGGLKVKTSQGIVTPTLSNTSTSVNMQPNTSSSTTTQKPQTQPQNPNTSQSTTSSNKPSTSTNKSTTNKKTTTKKTTTTKKQTTTTKNTNQEQAVEEQAPEEENEETENEEENEEQLVEDKTEKEQNNKIQEENIVYENRIDTEIEDKLNSVTRINMVFRIVIIVLVVVIVMFLIAFIIKKK